jgi:hypothetical protein
MVKEKHSPFIILISASSYNILLWSLFLSYKFGLLRQWKLCFQLLRFQHLSTYVICPWPSIEIPPKVKNFSAKCLAMCSSERSNRSKGIGYSASTILRLKLQQVANAGHKLQQVLWTTLDWLFSVHSFSRRDIYPSIATIECLIVILDANLFTPVPKAFEKNSSNDKIN